MRIDRTGGSRAIHGMHMKYAGGFGLARPTDTDTRPMEMPPGAAPSQACGRGVLPFRAEPQQRTTTVTQASRRFCTQNCLSRARPTRTQILLDAIDACTQGSDLSGKIGQNTNLLCGE